MPTGYTADIEKGITFNEFIMRCARAFGALVTMRDDSMDAKIPDEFKPQIDYYEKGIKRAESDLSRLNKMTDEEAAREAKCAYEKALADRNESIVKRDDLKRKYLEMLGEVIAWNPPTKDHEGLSKFMREQIEESIRCDCSWSPDPVKVITASEWRVHKIERATRDLEYNTNEIRKEIERCNDRTEWVRALRKSLE